MNLATLYTALLGDSLLKNNKWQMVDCYDLVTSSPHWNAAMILILPKCQTQNIEDALLYLLQKQAKSLGIWEREWITTAPTVREFINFFIAEHGFTVTIGKEMDSEIFYEKYSATIAGLTVEPSFEFTKNDKPETYDNLLQVKDILKVICFDNDWREENFLIETTSSWVLYHWSSNV